MSERDYVKHCPKCGKDYTGYAAMSRVGLGDIYPSCGQREALDMIGMDPNKNEKEFRVDKSASVHE